MGAHVCGMAGQMDKGEEGEFDANQRNKREVTLDDKAFNPPGPQFNVVSEYIC